MSLSDGTIVVAGGAGFLGSHLCERLLNDGHRVKCIDDFSTGTRANIVHLNRDENFEFQALDIIDTRRLHESLKEAGVRIKGIYNLACKASPVAYQNDPIGTLMTSFDGTKSLLDATLGYGDCFFLQASTSEIYGEPLEHPQREDYHGNVNTMGPRSCYDEGKRVAETLCYEYNKLGCDVKVVRIFNTYGPRMQANDGRVVSNFIVQALNGQDITIYGDGTQTRSFCYVDDLIDVIIKMANTEKGFIGPVNIGNPHEFQVIELAKKVIEMTGSKSKIVFKPLPGDDPSRRRPDITLAETKLGWRPKIELEEGLLKTIEYFRGQGAKS